MSEILQSSFSSPIYIAPYQDFLENVYLYFQVGSGFSIFKRSYSINVDSVLENYNEPNYNIVMVRTACA